jgi:secreted trypsin-like serine protease
MNWVGNVSRAAVAALSVAGLATAQEQSQIANGQNVPNGTYPWAVSLHTSATPSNANTWCSGSHVAPEFVLTAAHCFDADLNGVISVSENSANELWASLNRTLISDTSKGQVIQGQAVFLNPANDIALLRLASASSAPIVQLDPRVPANNTNVTTAGWGFFTTTNTLPDNMQRGFFRVVQPDGLDLLYINRNNEEMCGGDSGGPVFTELNGLARVVAAHTNSPPGCGLATGNARGSRVDSAIAWIRSVIDTNGFDRRASSGRTSQA